MKKFSKLLSILLCLSMVFSFLPTIASAADTESLDIFATTGTVSGKTITWTSSNFTFTNDQYNSSSAIRTTDSDHFRMYASSKTTIAATNGKLISSIDITATTASYASALAACTFSVGTAVQNDKVVTITFETPVESVEITDGKQVRLNKVAVTFGEAGDVHTCTFELTDLGDGTHGQKCAGCGTVDAATVTDHTFDATSFLCECGAAGEAVAIIVTNPTSGPYKLGLEQTGLGKNLYFTGEMDGYYFETTDSAPLGVDVYLEEVTGGYNLYFNDANGAKQYVYIEISGNYTNIKYGAAEKASVFTWNSEYNTLVTDVNGTTHYMGTYGTYKTISASKYEKIGTSYPSHLYKLADPSACLHDGTAVTYTAIDGNKHEVYCECGEMLETVSCDFSAYRCICGTWGEIPAADTELTIEQAAALAAAHDHNKYTEGKYYVTGTIQEIKSDSYGNMIIVDENGNTLYLYGLYSAVDGEIKYGDMANPPQVGKEIVVYGVLGNYNGGQMKSAWLAFHGNGDANHECDTCGKTLNECTDENNPDHKCDICGTSLSECAEGDTIDHKCDYCGATISECAEGDNVDHKCDHCSAVLSECDWDDATCTAPKTCSICGATEGEAKGHKWTNDCDTECDNGCGETRVIEHAWDEGTITKEPTCSAEGNIHHVCTVCDAEKDVPIEIDEEAHEWINGKVTTQPTCSAEGEKTYTCKHNADHTKTEKVDKNADNHVNDKEDDGICDDCGAAYCKHEFDTVVAAPTCEEQGYTTYSCKHCTYSYEDDYVEANGHDWDEGKVTKDPTCTTKGEKTFTCSECGETKTEDIAVSAHTWTDATCTAPKTCSVCKATEGEAKGHTWTDATCTAPKTCSVCSATEGKALGHTWTDATCKAPATCEECGETKGEKAEHDYDGGAVTTPPTTEAEGVKTYTCENCGHTYTEVIEKLPAEEEEPTTPSEPEEEEPADDELTIEEAVTMGEAMEHNTYTEEKYYVTGVITEVYNTMYGNMKITDEDGNILTIYGTWSADGETRYDALEVKPIAGDTVTIYGIVGQYNGVAQIKNGWIVEHTAAEVDPDAPAEPEVEDPAADSELTIGEAVELGSSKDHNTYTEGKYYLTGTIKEIKSDIYGNMIIVDENGDEILVYGTWSEDGTIRYDALEVKPVAGDTVTVYGIIGQYNGTAQMKNGWIVKHTAVTPSEPEEEEPTTPSEPEEEEPTEPTVKPGQNETVTGSEIADGKYIISFGDLTLGALDETYNYGYANAGSLAAYTNTDIVTITNVEGGFTIQDCYGRYIYLSGDYNSFNVSAEVPAEGHIWSFVPNGDTYTVINVAKNKTMAYSTQYTSWGCYPELNDDRNAVITLTAVRDASAGTGDYTISVVFAALLASAMGAAVIVSKKKEF